MSAAAHSMEMWTPRSATDLAATRRRTAVVHIMRLLLTTAAVVSAGFLIGPVVSNVFGRVAPPPPMSAANVTILSPRFEGRDANDKPFVVTADTAHRRKANQALIDLVNPKIEDETGATVIAPEGVYDRESQILDLVGGVVMKDSAGYTFNTESARMFARENRIVGKTQLQGFGPIGEVRADEYEVFDDGAHVVLTGNVWTKFVTTKKGSESNGR
jgi:lipopolysaccharide export system protein LptC